MPPFDHASARVAAGLAALCLAGPAIAIEPTYVVARASSPIEQVVSVSSFGAGSLLAGARATAFFSDGSSSTTLFVDTSFSSVAKATAIAEGSFVIDGQSDSSGAGFPDFFVTNLDSSRTLTGFRIDGRGDGAGQVAFDTDSFNAGTPGSNAGRELVFDTSLWPNSVKNAIITLNYETPLGLGGAAPAGDLFRSVRVDMPWGVLGGLPPATSFSGVFSSLDFTQDIDAVIYAAPVPLPAAWTALSLGLAALGAAARRRRV